jgi:hypothetical protein
MKWTQLEIPFSEYKDRQLQIPFDYEQEIAKVLDKEDSYTDYDESDEVLDSGDDDWYDPMLLDYMLKQHEE